MDRRTRRRRDRTLARERLEIRFQRTPQPGAVLGLEPLESVHVGEQRLAARPELDDLGLEPAALGVDLAARGGLGLGELRAGLGLRRRRGSGGP